MKQRVLVLFAHPSVERSEVNVELLRASRLRDGVTVVDLYAEYPTFFIDIEREQQRLRDHDVVVFMFPLFWYSTPAILKEWQDLVLEYGFAYGAGGDTLKDKVFVCSITAGGADEAYTETGDNHFTIRELLRPLEQTSRLCGMRFLAPFVLFGSRAAVDEGRVGLHVAEWGRVIEALRDGRLDLDAAESIALMTGQLDGLIAGDRA